MYTIAKRNRRMKKLVPLSSSKIDPMITLGNITVKYSDIEEIKDMNPVEGIPMVMLKTKKIIEKVSGITALQAHNSICHQISWWKHKGLI